MTIIIKRRIRSFIKGPLENGLTRGGWMKLTRIASTPPEVEPAIFWFEKYQEGATA